MKSQGNSRDIAALAMVSLRSSSGCLNNSNTVLGNSGSSSRKAPRCGPVKFLPVRGCCPLHQTRLGNRVMRKTERPVYDQRSGVVEKPGNAVNFRAFQSLFKTQLRKDRAQPPGQHRLARTRRTKHQQIMGSRRGHFKRPFDMLLSLDVLEIFAEDLPFLKKPRGL